MCTRVRSLTTGLSGAIFNDDEISDADLFDKSVVIDLSRIGSTETKSLIMGLLIMKLSEYRMTKGESDDLKHITVLEEAHNLLKRTSTEQSSESSNLFGKSVEMLANSIAEMRSYGEGFIIADQSPGLLDMSVIRNTNTKIIHRLPDKSDRELVGYSANLNDNQIVELSKLELGVAAIYQSDWIEPVLVKIDEFVRNKEEVDYIKASREELVVDFELFFKKVLGEDVDFTEVEKVAIEKWFRRRNVSAASKSCIIKVVNGGSMTERDVMLYELLKVKERSALVCERDERVVFSAIRACISKDFKLNINSSVAQELTGIALKLMHGQSKSSDFNLIIERILG